MTDLSGAEWRKSTHSYANGCVEVAFTTSSHGTDAHVRDSKDPNGPVLTFDRAEWTAFLAGVRSGEFDR